MCELNAAPDAVIADPNVGMRWSSPHRWKSLPTENPSGDSTLLTAPRCRFIR